ncbi:MAG: response regulator [Proteobacteria bacterium]|nr:response regulator [Pseudomonadota bacterium]
MKQKPTILVVDDELQNLRIISETLSDHFTVLEAENGKKALDLVSQDPDIQTIVLDWMMPGMDGIEVLRRLKKDKRYSKIPVIFHTTRNNVEDKITGLESGSFHYLEKPSNPKLMITTVNMAVDDYNQQKEEEALKEKAKEGIVRMVKKTENISLELQEQKSSNIESDNYKMFLDFFENTSGVSLNDAIEAAMKYISSCHFQNWEPIKISLLTKSNGEIIAISEEGSSVLESLEQKILEKALQDSYVEGTKSHKDNNCFTAWGLTSDSKNGEIGSAILIKNFPVIEKPENLEPAAKIQEIALAVISRLIEVIKLNQ